MSKLNRIALLVLAIIILTTFNPIQLNNPPQNFFFKIKNIEVLGTKIIDKKDITQRLVSIYDKNIFFIKKKELEEPLKTINFLGKIEVKKKYPDTIVIKVYETKPIAILFKKNKKYYLDNFSNLILYNKDYFSDNFPEVFGEEAEKNFVSFFNDLQTNNFPSAMIKKYYYFQVGRWDLLLKNDQLIKFPAERLNEAIKQSLDLIEKEEFKSYKVIDLRINGKIIVE